MAKAGWAEIGGKRHYFRSTWEVNYAHMLEWMKSIGTVKEWEYEAETFWFPGIKRGTVSYLPDFRVTLACGALEYHEVKGRMDPKSKTKIKRMAKYHPGVKLIVVDAIQYRRLNATIAGVVPGWVSPSKRIRRKRG